jgi:hypothetical protein
MKYTMFDKIFLNYISFCGESGKLWHEPLYNFDMILFAMFYRYTKFATIQ